MAEVILVDENDHLLGTMEKIEAHQKGILHRAFSVFIFNVKGEMLLQQRTNDKYHGGGLWSNACCSHPAPGEEITEAAEKRLKEEMGFTTELTHLFDLTYRAEFKNGLIEHEYDHVYSGVYDGEIVADDKEVKDHCFRKIENIREDIKSHPEKYTIWFTLAFERVIESLRSDS
jgi:isopentenyl-diphosphate Delta-isomerase